MTTFDTGRSAEQAVADYLAGQGYEVLEHNWRTRYCEIDIVARKEQTIYFVEVKYRRLSLQGEGFDYITRKKLKQMSFAAEMWVSNHDWDGGYCLAAASVAGDNYLVQDFIEI
jgi:uncharacterized protein (TIGR00252 family)